MNGGHDLGGMHGLGAITPEAEQQEPVFHYEWERRIFALTLATGFLGRWNLDQSRHARERQHPVEYLRNSYYENWLAGLERLLVESALLSQKELDTGRSENHSAPTTHHRVLRQEDVSPAMRRGSPTSVVLNRSARFKAGQMIRVINDHPQGHTRVPRYTRGRCGIITDHYGAHVYPDLHAHGQRVGEHLYNVCFGAEELWGFNNSSSGSVYVDLWEPYLELAED